MKKTITSFLFLGFLLCGFNFGATLNLSLYLEGYYYGSGMMHLGCAALDTITVELHDAVIPSNITASYRGPVLANGTIACPFNNSIVGNSYFIAIKHINSLQTWSAAPVMMTAVTSYNFTTSPTQTYGSNMIQVGIAPATWAFYTGDLNQDENIDLLDFPILDFGINNGLFGCYAADLNGDGNVDLLDLPILIANMNAGVFSRHP